MIKLKNVSKFYYSKGVIASGFTKVNLEFKMGEFIAITGESGSGKSTLLNVISGLDTYEEGEMHVNGEETSHYLEKDWEDYRRKYIGNIYQNFNLINSYTVYQNIELVLILNGSSRKEAKPKVLELISKVGLTKFKRTKVSKLSGGQKQRVAIARALAKDVPIIIADEPTGNLDKRSADSIIKLLSELSKDKLVIIVTHNYEQIGAYATRKITMHDGKVLEDKKLKEVEYKKPEENNYKNINFFNKLRLGIINTFNIIPKFILLLIVYLFIIASLMSEYSYFKKQEHENLKSGYNNIFIDTSEERIILKKKDRTNITNDDIDKISNLENINYVVKNDAIIDSTCFLNTTDDSYSIDGIPRSISTLSGKVDFGRLPENENEIVIEGDRNDYYLANDYKRLMEKTYNLSGDGSYNDPNAVNNIKIVGIRYSRNDDDFSLYSQYKIYLSSNLIDGLQRSFSKTSSDTTMNFLDHNIKLGRYNSEYKITSNKSVPEGSAFIAEYNKYDCPNENCINKPITVKVENLYYQDTINLSVAKYYNNKNITSVLELPNYSNDDYDGTIIYISPSDYNKLYKDDSYQTSIYVKDAKKLNTTIKEIDELGYETLSMKDVLIQSDISVVIRILRIIITIILVITLFFITYFVIKLILKSRNIYYTTVRMLGASKQVARQLLIIELLNITNISCLVFGILLYLNKTKLINYELLSTINTYLGPNDYIILYLILILLSFLISEKYAAKIFKKSVMNSYREEV